MFKNTWNNETISYPICEEYERKSTKTMLVTQTNSKVIVVTNVVIRHVIIFIMERAGFQTNSKMKFYICFYVFLFTLTNTGILILLTNANLKSQGIDINGTYSDFNANWYLISGDILTMTMLINSITPAVSVLINAIIKSLKIKIDQAKCGS
jgi:hypothetical protein